MDITALEGDEDEEEVEEGRSPSKAQKKENDQKVPAPNLSTFNVKGDNRNIFDD